MQLTCSRSVGIWPSLGMTSSAPWGPSRLISAQGQSGLMSPRMHAKSRPWRMPGSNHARILLSACMHKQLDQLGVRRVLKD